MTTPLRVLVTNAGRRKAIPIVRALGKAGMEVFCGETCRRAAAFYSRHCRGRFVYPEPGSAGFVDAVAAWLAANPCDAVFPLDDDVLEVLSAHRHRLPNPDALLLPDHEVVALACDKSRLLAHAQRVGIPVPRTVVLRRADELTQLANIALPAVVKPSRGSGSRGVIAVEAREQLRRACRRALGRRQAVLVQERIPVEGEGLGYFVLFDRGGRVVAEFMHRRLREYPLSGGPSTLREGIWDAALARQARRLLGALGWVGVAMVEFKRDPRDDTPKLMEVNPRFWGSIALAIFSGVNFPVLAAQAAAGRPTPRVPGYPLGRMARWLWPGDLLHLAASLRRGRWPRGFLKLFDRNMCYDLISAEDPAPLLALTWSAATALVTADGWRRLVLRARY